MVDHIMVEAALELALERKTHQRYFLYYLNFRDQPTKSDDWLVEILLENGLYDFVGMNIEKFHQVDRVKLAYTLVENRAGVWVVGYLHRYPGIDHVRLVELIIDSRNRFDLSDYLTEVDHTISKEVLRVIIRRCNPRDLSKFKIKNV